MDVLFFSLPLKLFPAPLCPFYLQAGWDKIDEESEEEENQQDLDTKKGHGILNIIPSSQEKKNPTDVKYYRN